MEDLNASLAPGARISGKVTIPPRDTTTTWGTTFSVGIVDAETGEVTGSERTMTSPDGSYEISDLAPGNYKVAFYYDSQIREWWDDAADIGSARPISLNAGEVRTAVDARLDALVSLPEPVFTEATCSSLANLKLGDFEHGTWSWTRADGPMGSGDSFDGEPEMLKFGAAYTVTANFDEGWGTTGLSTWRHVFHEPSGCDGSTSGRVSRLEGVDRFATAVEASESEFAAGVDVVYIANGLNFPDALAAGPVAAANGGPVLLVAPWFVPDVVKDELERLQPKRIVVLGGEPSVNASVLTELRGFTSGRVSRLEGVDRFATAVEASESEFAAGVDVVYIANGLNFPDALAAGPVAAANGGPVLLVAPWFVPDVVKDELERLQPKRIVVLGGEPSVNASVLTELRGFTSGRVSRLEGVDRFATAVEASESEFAAGVDVVYIANGLNFPDALAAGPVAAANGGPVLLVAPWFVPDVVKDELERLQPKRIVVLGGEPSVNASVLTELEQHVSAP